MKEENKEYHCKVKVVDEIMGGGKTCAAINFINALPDDVKIIYVTPYNSDEQGKPNEVRRIIRACRDKGFVEPHYLDNRKINHLKQLVVEGQNIATTHALFHMFAEDDELTDLIREQGYILIMDEITQVISPYKELSKKADMDLLTKGEFVKIEQDDKVVWLDDSYNGNKFSREKRLANQNSLVYYGADEKGKDSIGLVELFPMCVFDAFDEAYILTYMFECQLQAYYFKYHGLKYEYIYVKGDNPNNFTFTDDINEKREIKRDYRSLITIYTDPKLEKMCKKRTALSMNWFKNQKKYNEKAFNALKNSLYNFYRRGYKRCKNDFVLTGKLWTTFKEFETKIRGKGYSKGFATVNLRASNDYRDCNVIAYVANRFLNPVNARFFRSHGVEVDEDGYALSEMLQFIWRSAIRDNKPIIVFVPSKRMADLLQDWIDKNTDSDSIITSAKSA